MIGEIQVTCDAPGCGERYWLPLVRGQKRTQDLIFDYAVCPYCERARNPQLRARERCADCGVPMALIGGHAAKGRCWRDYKALRKREKLTKTE